jgi:hypothetical protein
MAVLQFAAGLAVGTAVLWDGLSWREAAVTAAVLVVATLAGVWLTRRRGGNPLDRPVHLDETWDRIVAAATPSAAEARARDLTDLLDLSGRPSTVSPVTDQTSLGMRLAVTTSYHAWHVSLSHPARRVDGVANALRPRWTHSAHGITHLLLTNPAHTSPQPGPNHRDDTLNQLDQTGPYDPSEPRPDQPAAPAPASDPEYFRSAGSRT